MAVRGRLLGLEVGRGLFKPMAVTVSFPGQGPHGDLSEMQHLRPHLGPLSQNLGGGSYLGFHMPPLKCGDLCFLSSQLRLVV